MTTTPPPDVTEDLESISKAMDKQIPSKTESNLLIGIWNIRAFSDLTEKSSFAGQAELAYVRCADVARYCPERRWALSPPSKDTSGVPC